MADVLPLPVSPPGAHPAGPRTDQRGESLVESLLTLAILAVVIPVGLLGVWVVLGAGTEHDGSARAEAVVRTAAESLQNPDTPYVVRAGCPGRPGYTVPDPAPEQPDLTVAVTAVEFWSNRPPATTSPLPPAADVEFASGCPAEDPGLQRLTVTATGPTGSHTLTVVKRRQ